MNCQKGRWVLGKNYTPTSRGGTPCPIAAMPDRMYCPDHMTEAMERVLKVKSTHTGLVAAHRPTVRGNLA